MGCHQSDATAVCFERYLAIIKNSGIKPAIIINKTDLISTEELDAKLAEIKSRFGDIDVFATSIKSDESLEKTFRR